MRIAMALTSHEMLSRFFNQRFKTTNSYCASPPRTRRKCWFLDIVVGLANDVRFGDKNSIKNNLLRRCGAHTLRAKWQRFYPFTSS